MSLSTLDTHNRKEQKKTPQIFTTYTEPTAYYWNSVRSLKVELLSGQRIDSVGQRHSFSRQIQCTSQIGILIVMHALYLCSETLRYRFRAVSILQGDHTPVQGTTSW